MDASAKSPAELERELETRTRELAEAREHLAEALQQQTATSEVLRVISSSPGELQPVFNTILANATRICEAKFGVLHFAEKDAFRTVAIHNAPPDYVEAKRRDPMVRYLPKTSALARVMETRQPVQVADVREEPAYNDPNISDNVSRLTFAQLTGVRSLLAIPMVKDNFLLGAIVIYRQEVRAFADKQIELLTSFASQAVIAIENARLFDEVQARTRDLSEALEQQTATSEVLRVISSSPGELEPVFQAMLENATRLCEAKFGTMYFREGDAFRAVAMHGAPPAYMEARLHALVRPGPTSGLGRVVQTKDAVQIEDAAADRGYADRDPMRVSAVEIGGIRTLLDVPMLKEKELIGARSIAKSCAHSPISRLN